MSDQEFDDTLPVAGEELPEMPEIAGDYDEEEPQEEEEEQFEEPEPEPEHVEPEPEPEEPEIPQEPEPAVDIPSPVAGATTTDEKTPDLASPSTKELQKVYLAFARFGKGAGAKDKELDGKAWAKLCKECGLLSKKTFTTTDVDLVFAKAKDKTARKITYKQFKQALELVAKHKSTTVDTITAQIVAAGGPKASGTRAGPSRFFENKPNSRRALAAASPKAETVKPKRTPRASGARSPAAKPPSVENRHRGGASAAEFRRRGAAAAAAPPEAPPELDEETNRALRRRFLEFARFGAGNAAANVKDMDGAKWAKLAKDCGIISRKFTRTDVDLTFAKAKPKDKRKIGFASFKRLLNLTAQKSGQSYEAVVALVVSANASNSGTVAAALYAGAQ